MFDKSEFRLKAILTKDIDTFECREMTITDSYAYEVPNDWYKQYFNFVTRKEYIDFKPGDDGEENELVVINDFELPTYFQFISEDYIISDSPLITHNHMQPKVIKSIIGVTNYRNNKLILFQKFQDHIQLTSYRNTLSLDTNSLGFKVFNEPLISLGRSIIAVYEIENKKLIFKRFTDVNTILLMDEYFREASPPEIREFLRHNLFEVNENELSEIINEASPLLAKRFALVKESGILNKISAEDIQRVSLKYKETEGYNVNITLSQNRKKVIFPNKKSEAHNFLRLLNQDFYTGDFDGNPFLARDKRPV